MIQEVSQIVECQYLFEFLWLQAPYNIGIPLDQLLPMLLHVASSLQFLQSHDAMLTIDGHEFHIFDEVPIL
jgi:hypothetical protein